MNEHKNIITIEDEIKEFSDKPVKSSAIFKALQNSGGGSSFGKKVFSGTVTDTPQPIEITDEQVMFLPRYVGTINGEPITYMDIDIEDGAIWLIGNDDGAEIEIGASTGTFTVAAYDGDCEVKLIDMGPRFISVPALLQADTIYVEYPFDILRALVLAGCGLGLHVRSGDAGGEGHSYAPIILYSNDVGDAYFDSAIQIGNDTYTTWTVDAETGAITGTTGGSTYHEGDTQ